MAPASSAARSPYSEAQSAVARTGRQAEWAWPPGASGVGDPADIARPHSQSDARSGLRSTHAIRVAAPRLLGQLARSLTLLLASHHLPIDPRGPGRNGERFDTVGTRLLHAIARGVCPRHDDRARRVRHSQHGARGGVTRGTDYRNAAAMFPPSTVVTPPVVFIASAWCRNASATSSALTSWRSRFPRM